RGQAGRAGPESLRRQDGDGGGRAARPDGGRTGGQPRSLGPRTGGLMSEPEGRVGVWTDERGACDERGGKTPAAGAPEASEENSERGQQSYEGWSLAGWRTHLPGVADAREFAADLGDRSVPELAASSAAR